MASRSFTFPHVNMSTIWVWAWIVLKFFVLTKVKQNTNVFIESIYGYFVKFILILKMDVHGFHLVYKIDFSVLSKKKNLFSFCIFLRK